MREPVIHTRSAAREIRRRKASRTRAVFAVSALLVIAVAGAVLALGALRPTSSHSAAADSTPDVTTPPTVTTPTVPIAEEPTAPPEPSGPATITIAAAGDMIFDRQVKSLIESKGGLEPLRYVAEHLAAADIAVGNLESPLSSAGTRNAAKDVTFRGDPRGYLGLKAAGFDFLALANNHVLDYGPDALADTISLLDQAGIAYAGAGMNKTEAWRPAVREVHGASVAFLSFSHILPAGFIATDSKAGLAPGRTDMAAVAEAIKAAKAEHDYVIVSFHWGVEYKDDANGDQVRDGRAAVDAGADMVLSHHPHVIQGIEFYNGSLIAYSLGDFVFDHYSRKTGEAFILDAELGPHGIANVRATPVYLQGFGQPKFVSGQEATTILERLKKISGPHGTSVVIEGDTAAVLP